MGGVWHTTCTMPAPPFIAADPHPDGSGATFYDPSGRPTKLYGGPALLDFARTLPPGTSPAPQGGSMATSPGALAMGPGGGPLGVPDQAAADFIAQAPQVYAEQDAQRANPGSHVGPALQAPGVALPGTVPSFSDLEARTAPAGQAAPESPPPGQGFGTTRPPTQLGAPARGPQFPGLDEGMAQYYDTNEILDRALRQAYRGGPATPAGYRPTTRTNQREGTASAETAAAIADAQRAAAEGRAMQLGAQQGADMGQQAAYAAGAQHMALLLQQLAQTQNRRADLGEREAQRLDAEAAKRDSLGGRAAGLLGDLVDNADAIMQGRDTSKVGDSRAETRALRQQALAIREGGADAATRQIAQGAGLVDALAQARSRAAGAGGAAAGRPGEATAALAQGDVTALQGLGAREAALQGTTNMGEKWQAASGGGPSVATLLQIAGMKRGLGDSYSQAGAVRGAGKAGGGQATLMIGSRAVPVDPTLPQAVQTKLWEQADGLAKAEAALARIQAARAKLGARQLTPEFLQGEAGAELRSAIQAFARNESIAEGMGTLQEADRQAAEAQFLSTFNTPGTIREKVAKMSSARVRLTQVATGGGR